MSWLNMPCLLDHMSVWWEEDKVQGYRCFKVWSKQKAMRQKMITWKHEVLNKWQNSAHNLESDISKLDKQEESNMWSEALSKERAQLKQKLDEMLLNEEMDWKQRARCSWVKEGDRNTRYFQAAVKARQQTNSLHSLMIGDKLGNKSVVVEQHIINHFRKMFEELFQFKPTIQGLQFSKISNEQGEWLTRTFSAQELESVLNSLADDKAPGVEASLWVLLNNPGSS